LLLGLGGGALFVVLLTRNPIGETAKAIAAARYGLLAIIALHFVQLVPETLAWAVLLPREHRRRSLYWISWVGESVGTLLPVATVGGDVLRARMAAVRGVPGPLAASSVLVDVTLSVVVQVVYTCVGLVLLVMAVGRSHIVWPATVGTLLLLLGVAGFYFVQRYGVFRLIAAAVSRFAKGSSWQDLVRQGDEFDAETRKLYGQPWALLANGFFTFVCWLVTAAEVWVALRAVGIHAGFAEACILESVSRAVRSGAFVVPGALGLQEGGYLVVGRLLGIDPGTAMALALIRRVRELAFGVPGLVVWNVAEWRRLWRRGDGDSGSSAGSGAVSTP